MRAKRTRRSRGSAMSGTRPASASAGPLDTDGRARAERFTWSGRSTASSTQAWSPAESSTPQCSHRVESLSTRGAPQAWQTSAVIESREATPDRRARRITTFDGVGTVAPPRRADQKISTKARSKPSWPSSSQPRRSAPPTATSTAPRHDVRCAAAASLASREGRAHLRSGVTAFARPAWTHFQKTYEARSSRTSRATPGSRAWSASIASARRILGRHSTSCVISASTQSCSPEHASVPQ